MRGRDDRLEANPRIAAGGVASPPVTLCPGILHRGLPTRLHPGKRLPPMSHAPDERAPAAAMLLCVGVLAVLAGCPASPDDSCPSNPERCDPQTGGDGGLPPDAG